MDVYVKETLYVLDYDNNIKEAIFISDDHITPGYAYNIVIKEANTGYSDLIFEMPNTILTDDGKKTANPKLDLLVPLVKLRYHRTIYYTGEREIKVREPEGYGDVTTYIEKTYSKDYPNNIMDDYLMDYVVQPVDKKRNTLQISTTFTAIDYPRFTLSKKRVGMLIDDETLTKPEWSLFSNKLPIDVQGLIKYIPWDEDLNSLIGGEADLDWDPAYATKYPLTKEQVKRLKDAIKTPGGADVWPNGFECTSFYWPITETGRYKGVLYEKGNYIAFQGYDLLGITVAGLDPELHTEDKAWHWTQVYAMKDWLCPNNADNYLHHVLDGTAWSVAQKLVPVLDEQGNPVLDENDEPVMEWVDDVDIEKVPVYNIVTGELEDEVDHTCRISLSGSNCYNAITAICQNLQLYPIFDCVNRTVALKLASGKNYGLVYSLGNNIKSDAVKDDGEKVITKLWCSGGSDDVGSANINIGPATRQATSNFQGFYYTNDSSYTGDLPNLADVDTSKTLSRWAIVDSAITSFETTTWELKEVPAGDPQDPSRMKPVLVDTPTNVSDYRVPNYWETHNERQVYFLNENKQWVLGTEGADGLWYYGDYAVDPATGLNMKDDETGVIVGWDPNDAAYIEGRSPYWTNYIINLKWAYDNGWITQAEILELYQYNLAIAELNRAFGDKYNEDLLATQIAFHNAENEYDIAQDKYETTLRLMKSKYYYDDNDHSQGYVYCFHVAPQGTYKKDDGKHYIKLFHCYNCKEETEPIKPKLVEVSPSATDYDVIIDNKKYIITAPDDITTCPNCGCTDINLLSNEEIEIPVYDDYESEITPRDDQYPYGTDITNLYSNDHVGGYRYNPNTKGYYLRLVISLDKLDRNMEDLWDIEDYEKMVSLIEPIPVVEVPVTTSFDSYNYYIPYEWAKNAGVITGDEEPGEGEETETDPLYIRSTSGQIIVWNQSIDTYITNWGKMLDAQRQMESALRRIDELEEAKQLWLSKIAELDQTIQDNFGDFLIEGNYQNTDQPHVPILFNESLVASKKNAVPEVTYNLDVVDSSGLVEYRYPFATQYVCAQCNYRTYKLITKCPRCECEVINEEHDIYNDLVKMLHSVGQIIPKAGDYVSIYDDQIGFTDTPGLITEVDRYLDAPIKNSIQIDTSYTTADVLVGNIINATNTVLSNKDIYARTAILNADGTLDPASIANTLNSNQTNISIAAPDGTMVLDNSGLECVDPTNINNAIKYSGTGVYKTTNYKEKDSEDNDITMWEAMMTPDGINASYINSGTIDTGKINITAGAGHRVLLDQFGLTVKGSGDASTHLTDFDVLKAKTQTDYARDWGNQNNIATFVGIDNTNTPLIYTKGFLVAEEGSNIANWITSNDGFYHLYLTGANVYMCPKCGYTMANDFTTCPNCHETVTAEYGPESKKDLWLSPIGMTRDNYGSDAQLGNIDTLFTMYVNDNFGVDNTGKLYAKDASISGDITGGSININNNFIVTSNGSMTAKDGTIGGWTIEPTQLSGSGKLQGGSISGSVISGGTVTGSTIRTNWSDRDGAYRTIFDSNGSIKYYNGIGYLTCGLASGTNHPWLSGLNVNQANGIAFQSGSNWNDVGQETAYIHMSGSSLRIKNELSNGNINIEGINIAIDSTKSTTNYARLNKLYACSNDTYTWLVFNGVANSNPLLPRIRCTSTHMVLLAGSGGGIYAGGDSADNKIKTAGGTPSSLNVKTNLVSLKDEYDTLYEEMKQVEAYNYDYKYKNVNGDLTKDYGFIIDEIEHTKHLSKYFKDYSVQRVIKDNTLYPIDMDNKEQQSWDKIDIKVWDTDSYIKGLFVMIKTLQHKIDELETEIRKEKTN